MYRASYVRPIPQIRAPPTFLFDAYRDIVCGSLAKGNEHRQIREGDRCECDEGWGGINCNVCNDDRACNSLMESGEGGVCYQRGNVLKNNYQMCDVTNDKIRDLLGEQVPQVTFTCNKPDGRCDFQCKYTISPIPNIYELLTHCSLGGPKGIFLLHFGPVRIGFRFQR